MRGWVLSRGPVLLLVGGHGSSLTVVVTALTACYRRHMDPSVLRVSSEMRVAQSLKDELVRRDGIGSDLPPMLHLLREGQTLAWLVVGEDDVADLDPFLSAVGTLIGLSDADEACYMSEGFAIVPGGSEHGDYQARFAAGDPEVYECLAFAAGHFSGRFHAALSEYRYEGRRIRWLGTRTSDDLGEGLLARTYEQAWAYQDRRKAEGFPTLPIADLAVAVGCQMAVVPILRPRRPDGPCGCESGRMAAECCWG